MAINLANPPAKDPKLRRQGELAAIATQAYACGIHSYTTPEERVLFPAMRWAPTTTTK
jgi:hypothetical protein